MYRDNFISHEWNDMFWLRKFRQVVRSPHLPLLFFLHLRCLIWIFYRAILSDYTMLCCCSILFDMCHGVCADRANRLRFILQRQKFPFDFVDDALLICERNFNLFAMLASCAHFHLAWSVIILSSLDDCCESTQPPSSLRCSKYWRLAETASIIYEYCVCVHPNAYHAHTPHALAETNENRRRK